LFYYQKQGEEIAFKWVINELNHECLHQILIELIDVVSSICMDNLELQHFTHVGFNSIKEFKDNL